MGLPPLDTSSTTQDRMKHTLERLPYPGSSIQGPGPYPGPRAMMMSAEADLAARLEARRARHNRGQSLTAFPTNPLMPRDER